MPSTSSVASSSRTPVGSPAASRTMTPCSGSGVSAGDSGELERLAVDRDDVAAARDEDRVVRRDRVEVGARRQATLVENALVPRARHHDPVARRRLGDTLGDGGAHVVHVLGVDQRDPGDVQRRPELVQVAVDQARDHGAPAKVHDRGAVCGEGLHLGIRADCAEPAVGDRERLRDVEGIVDGDDLAIVEDHLGRGVLRGGVAGREHGRGNEHGPVHRASSLGIKVTLSSKGSLENPT